MKNLKFWSLFVALFLGLSFGFTSCGDDEEKDEKTEKTIVEDETIQKGQTFYQNLDKAVNGTTEEKAVAITSVVATGFDYKNHKSDAEWTTNFLAGVAMEKYGVADKAIAKTDEYQQKVAAVKAVLDEGFTSENVSNVLIQLSSFISNK